MLLAICLGIFLVGILMVPTAFADHITVTVSNAPGSSSPGCEETSAGCFIPNPVTVDIGGTVTWENVDTAAHTSTSGTSTDGPSGGFDSSLIMSGSSFSHTFDEAGTFDYFCMVHPWMRGTVIVGDTAAEDAATAAESAAQTAAAKAAAAQAAADNAAAHSAEVKSQTDIGTVMIEKSEYRIAPREVVYVKVFGEVDMDNPVNHPIDYTQFLTFETTKPDGTKFITQVNKNQSGYFENPIPISYDKRACGDVPASLCVLGKYQVYVTFKNNSLGNLVFWVVDKATAEAADEAAAKAAAAAAAAQAAADKAAAEAAAVRAKAVAEAAAAQAERERIEQERLEQKRLEDIEKQKEEHAQLPKIESDNPQRDIEFYLHKARAFGVSQYWGESMKYFDHALALSKPGSSQYQEIREQKGNIHRLADRYYQTLDSDDATNTQRGLSYVIVGEPEKGLDLCYYALENNSDDDGAFACQVGALLKLDKYEEILELYKYYPHLVDSITGTHGLGVLWMIGGIPVPPDVIAHYHLGHYDKAYEILEVTRNHADPRIAVIYALPQIGVLEKQGKGDLGSIVLRETLRDPAMQGLMYTFNTGQSGIDYNFIRGWIYFALRDFEKSVEYLETIRGQNDTASTLKVIAYYEWDKRSPSKQIENVLIGSDDPIYGGCGKGTVLVDGVCKTAPSTQAKYFLNISQTLYIVIAVIVTGGIVGAFFVVKRRSKTPNYAKQGLGKYKKKHLTKQKPSGKPAKKTSPSFCRFCGKPLKLGAQFCGMCGRAQS